MNPAGNEKRLGRYSKDRYSCWLYLRENYPPGHPPTLPAPLLHDPWTRGSLLTWSFERTFPLSDASAQQRDPYGMCVHDISYTRRRLTPHTWTWRTNYMLYATSGTSSKPSHLTMSVIRALAHIAAQPSWSYEVHRAKIIFVRILFPL